MLPLQLHVHRDALNPALVQPVADRLDPREVRPDGGGPPSDHDKPSGGLWTANYQPQIGSTHLVGAAIQLPLARWMDTLPPKMRMGHSWSRWGVQVQGDQLLYQGWVLTPTTTTRVYTLDRPAALAALWATYGREGPHGPYLAFSALAADYDALHYPGTMAVPLQGPPPRLLGWRICARAARAGCAGAFARCRRWPGARCRCATSPWRRGAS